MTQANPDFGFNVHFLSDPANQALVRDNISARPRGFVVKPEDYGAKGDLTLFQDGAIQSGTATLTSAAFTAASLPSGANSKNIYVGWAGAGTTLGTTNGATGTSAITSISRAAASPATVLGPLIISNGANAQLFTTTTAGSTAAITVISETPLVNFASGSALSYGNVGLSTTIVSTGAGTATLAANATQTVQNMCGWFGTDDTAAFRAALAAIETNGGGTLLLTAAGYLVDGAPISSKNGNAILPLPLVKNGSVSILGTAGSNSSSSAQIGYMSTEMSGTTIATTRQTDTYSGTNGPPSILGGPTFEKVATQNPQVAMVRMEDLTFLKPENPTIGSCDLSLVARTEKRRCLTKTAGALNYAAYNFTTYTAYGKVGQIPTNANNFGFWMPDNLNFNTSTAEDCGAQGDLVGYVMSAHTVLTNCYSQFCTAAIGSCDLGGRATGTHLNVLAKFGSYDTNYGFTGWDPQNGIKNLPATTNLITFSGDISWEAGTTPWNSIAQVNDQNGRFQGKLISHNQAGLGPLASTPSAGLQLRDAQISIVPISYDDAVLADSPLVYAKLDETTGTVIRDISGNGHAGTITGDAAAAKMLGYSGPLNYDGALRFRSASSQHAELDVLSTIGANIGTSTWELWVNTTAVTQQAIFGTSHATLGTQFFLEANTDNTAALSAGKTCVRLLDQAGANHRLGHITTNIYDGKWHHVVIQPSTTGTHAVWVDGIPVTVTMEASPGTLGTLAAFNNPMSLACLNATGGAGFIIFFDGRLSKFAAYTSQLTLAKIVAHYAAATRMR